MKISVIVVDFRNLEYTKRCLESLYATDYKDKEIIVVDNNSGDESYRFYKSEESKGKIKKFYSMQKNYGLAIANNFGVKFAKGDFLFFLNNDTLVKPDIFENLLGYYQSHNYEVLGCRMFNYDGSKELDSAVSVDRFGCPAGKTGPMFYPDGAIFILKGIFNQIGGFDEKLFLYGEDRDLCWRIWLAGYTVGYNSNATFFHNSSCVADTNFFRRKTSEKCILRSILKNYSLKNLPWILIQYSFWSMLELGLILFTKPQAIWRCYLPAYWWNIVNFKDTLKARKKVIHRISDSKVPFSKVIGKLYVLRTQGVPKWR